MEEKLIDLLECNQILRNHIKDFIEIFVAYYGENERKYIEDRFNSAQFVGYLSEREYEKTLEKLEQIQCDKIYNEVTSKTRLGLTKIQIFGTDIDDYTYDDDRYHPITKYKLFYEECLLGEEKRIHNYYTEAYNQLGTIRNYMTFEEYMQIASTGRLPQKYDNLDEKYREFLLEYVDITYQKDRYEKRKIEAVEFAHQIYPDITVQNIEQRISGLTELNELLEYYKEGKKKFEEVKRKNEKYHAIIEHNTNLKDSLSDKYYKEFLKQIIIYIPEKYKEEIKKYINNEIPAFKSYEIGELIGFFLSSACLYEYFTKEMDEIIGSEDVPEWEKDSIKRKRIKYFKIIGIDLGDDYNNYAKNKEIWPSKDAVNDILNVRREMRMNYSSEYYSNMLPAKSIIEESKDKGFLDIKEDEFIGVYTRSRWYGHNMCDS